jgi:hypothetical protein
MNYYVSQSIHYKYFGLRIILTSSLPIGDFDKKSPPIMDEPYRLYKTNKGFRVFYISRYKPDVFAMLKKMQEQGADISYIEGCRKNGMYVARLEPKYPRMSGDYAVCKFIKEEGARNTEWNEFIQVHDEWTKANSGLELL